MKNPVLSSAGFTWSIPQVLDRGEGGVSAFYGGSVISDRLMMVWECGDLFFRSWVQPKWVVEVSPQGSAKASRTMVCVSLPECRWVTFSSVLEDFREPRPPSPSPRPHPHQGETTAKGDGADPVCRARAELDFLLKG